jgi:hypothetical protein
MNIYIIFVQFYDIYNFEYPSFYVNVFIFEFEFEFILKLVDEFVFEFHILKITLIISIFCEK